MAEHTQEAGGGGADFDLSQFYEIFFEEAGENLDQMEQMLVGLDLSQADDEALNGIFRCAHSIKGGAATFGFRDVTELTHHMESLLDKLRRHEITPVPQMVDVLLESADASRSLLARHQNGGQGEVPPTAGLVQRIAELAAGNVPATAAPAPVAAPAPAPAPAPVVAAAPPAEPLPPGVRRLTIHIGPLPQPELADALQDLFRDIPGLGTMTPLESAQTDRRSYEVTTSSSNDDLLDLFVFHVAKELVDIREESAAPTEDPLAAEEARAAALDQAAAQGRPATPPLAESESYGFFQEPAALAPAAAAPARAAAPAPAAAAGAASQSSLEATSIRVAVSKVDQIINLVGELVITQAMLAQNSRALEPALHQQLFAGLADLDRNTRDLQESVMSIRMIPMSFVFNRFPRMLRDLANKLGKKVDFVTQGEATELDKGLVEKITDPLTHLVRNSCDHGIEMPADRLAAGKPEHGTITLAASHQGGSIVIEVRDDGKGLSREKILSKARERGLSVSDSMPDSEVWQLIFAPGFSTAEVVTDVSGRGVGMDVVKRNIAALGGTVDIDSDFGRGMKVSVRLPLTLAIMDGMSVRVGDEVYILPLSAVVESFQVQDDAVSTVAQGAQLVKVRDEFMPVIELERLFQVPPSVDNGGSGIMVVVESEGSRAALLVSELLGQHQVVVKNLESNYRKVANVSGATILGDGKVALILDIGALVRRTRH
ncbi:chemotaxis protein CheW [Pseudorhodoferax soli]|uniref:Chemotaxis protein CheA n=1 Tax=Pseudorhodoferax soli TaxID=545864 RepID=A0A368XJ70_9BURK|nr:chemotaxis protein CheW [Pseudorhodoferax soli]RCW67639.1 two-component system chemotaxis sensor kinase CheA [Pseudorhodoferax soli]